MTPTVRFNDSSTLNGFPLPSIGVPSDGCTLLTSDWILTAGVAADADGTDGCAPPNNALVTADATDPTGTAGVVAAADDTTCCGAAELSKAVCVRFAERDTAARRGVTVAAAATDRGAATPAGAELGITGLATPALADAGRTAPPARR